MSQHRSIPGNELVRLEEVENSSIDTMISMKDCVAQFADNSTGSTAIKVSNIHEVWEDIAGKDVSQHVRLKHIKDGVLYVVADHPAWLTQMKYMESHIVFEVNKILGESSIEKVSLSISRGK